MATVIRQPTANTTPDPAQGGSAVTGNTNTGHASSTVSTVGLDDQWLSCLWTAFPPAVNGLVRALMFEWSENGSVTGGGVNNFRVQYSLNGGGAWVNALNHTPITGPNSGSVLVNLAATDISQIQVRDFIESSSPGGGTASTTASVSNIRLEVVASDGLLVMM